MVATSCTTSVRAASGSPAAPRPWRSPSSDGRENRSGSGRQDSTCSVRSRSIRSISRMKPRDYRVPAGVERLNVEYPPPRSMRFLGIGKGNDLADMYLRIQQRGHDVRVYVGDPQARDIFRGMLT